MANVDQTTGEMSSGVRVALDRIQQWGPYGYRPDLGLAVMFTCSFGMLALVATFQGVHYRSRWLLYTLALGSALECIGCGLRIDGYYHPASEDAYFAQQSLILLAPTFIVTAHFKVLVKLCRDYAGAHDRTSNSDWLVLYFGIIDFASRSLVAIGTVLAATAHTRGETVLAINRYGYIAVFGFLLQATAYLIFAIIFALLVLRSRKEAGQYATDWFATHKQLLWATATSATLLLARTMFRAVQMTCGWVSELATTEWITLVFDITLVALSVLLLAIFCPVRFLSVGGAEPEALDVEDNTSSSGETAKEEVAPPRPISKDGSIPFVTMEIMALALCQAKEKAEVQRKSVTLQPNRSVKRKQCDYSEMPSARPVDDQAISDDRSQVSLTKNKRSTMQVIMEGAEAAAASLPNDGLLLADQRDGHSPDASSDATHSSETVCVSEITPLAMPGRR